MDRPAPSFPPASGPREQSQIAQTLGRAEGLVRVRALLAAAGSANRTELARQVCAAFGFHDARGRPQLAGCLKALRSLARREGLPLPAPRHGGGGCRPRRLDRPVPAPSAVPAHAAALRDLRLELVTSPARRALWNELMAREHPRGAAGHVGAQLRYLVVSAHGILGAVGFAASALTLQARDAWIGWDAAQRGRQLHRVLALSRFLIRPSVQCRHLASRVLGLALRRLPADFEARYGYRPVLVETFVDETRQAGTCFRAANWVRVGQTAGRGRAAPSGHRVPVKAIYLYPLVRDWRAQLGGCPPAPPAPVPAAPPPSAPPAAWPQAGGGLALPGWAEREFGGAPLGDVRLSRRLVQSAQLQAAQPTASFPTAADSDGAAVRGHYRLLDQPAASQVTSERILAPHRRRTVERMQHQTTVLCLQDGTDLNFAEHPGCVGLGLIAQNRGSAGTLGLHLHSTLAVNEEGLPLGVPQLQFEAPDGRRERAKPLEERKTQRWVRGLRECAALAAQLDGVRPVAVMDREGDAFALFAEQARLGTIDLLVRARHNRVLGQDQANLFDRIRAAPAQARLAIAVPRLSARRSTGRQTARAARAARTAQVALRWQAVQLPAPTRRGPPCALHLVHVREETPPPGAERLEWFLLTSVPVDSPTAAERILRWYRLRWRIEEWHRVLKTGCRAEYLGLRRRERLERAITIKAVIAWRLLALTLLGRETPELPPDVLFSDLELLALEDFARDRRLPPPTTLGQAVLTLAIQGGYLNRRRDPPPGVQKIWEGFIRLQATVDAYQRLLRLRQHSQFWQRLSPD